MYKKSGSSTRTTSSHNKGNSSVKKSSSFWDNPFGGLADFNGDGREDLGEQWLAIKIAQDQLKKKKSKDCPSEHQSAWQYKDDNDTSWYETCEDGSRFGVYPVFYDTKEEYKEALHKTKYAWREFCEDGAEFNIDPEDFETEEEYEDALDEAKNAWRETCEDGTEFGIHPEDYIVEETYNEAIEKARQEELEFCAFLKSLGDSEPDPSESIREEDFPNKRRYYAAYTLANRLFFSEDESQRAQEEDRCRFIIEQADTIPAANYLSVDLGFLYAQAIKDHFSLPIHVPDEDNVRGPLLCTILYQTAKRDTPLSLEVWNWCLETFMPYAQYDDYAISDMTNEITNNLGLFPKGFRLELIRYMDKHPRFTEMVLGTDGEATDGLSALTVVAIENKMPAMALTLFRAALAKVSRDAEEIDRLVGHVLYWCKVSKTFRTIEYFRDNLLPLIREIDIESIQGKFPAWESKIAELIAISEGKCNGHV